MVIEVQVPIDAPKSAVWAVVADIENWETIISGVDKIEILDKPAAGLVGLKWRETRTLFGKTATEVMWITNAAENEFHESKAVNHGFTYLATRRLSERDGGTLLTMTHETQPQGFLARLMIWPMGVLMKGMLKKEMLNDLNDIKAAVENRGGI